MVRRVIRPWPVSVLFVTDRGVGPGQGVESIEQGGPILLDGQHEVTALLVDEFRGGLDGVQRVGGDGHVPQIEGLQDGTGGFGFAGLGAVGRRLRYDDGGRVGACCTGQG